MALLQLMSQLFVEQQGSSLFLPISLSLLLSFAAFLWFKRGSVDKLKLPSPPRLPIIGNFHQLGTLPHRTLRDLSNKYGPLMLLHLGKVPTLVVSSAEMAREITKTQDLAFANRPVSTAGKTFFYGCTDVGFAPYGEYWREVRKTCIIELLNSKKVQSFDIVRKEEVGILIEKLTRACSTGATVNLTEMLLSLANNLIAKVAFGNKYDDEEDGTARLRHLTRDVLTLMGAFSVGDFFPSFGWVDVLTGLDGRIKKTFTAMDAFFTKLIEEHEMKSRDDGSNHADHDVLLDILLRAQKNKTLNISVDNIKAVILDMFVAGTDTVSLIGEWAIIELLRKPEEMKKAQEEVRRVIGRKAKVEESDIHSMEYLKCIIKEILRLHLPAPFLIPRESTRDTNVAGYHIPAKTRVFVNAWAIQRDPNSWTNPEEFIPERFMNSPIDFKGQDFEYIPFGAGRRGCPGMSFGIIASEYLLANLLYWFDWNLPAGLKKEDIDMTEAFGLTVYKKNPTYLVPTLHFG